MQISALMEHKHCSLATLVSFKDRQTQSERVVHYECADASYNEFGTVYRILQRSYVSAEEVAKNIALIDFYGLDSGRTMHAHTHTFEHVYARVRADRILMDVAKNVPVEPVEPDAEKIIHTRRVEHETAKDVQMVNLGHTHCGSKMPQCLGYNQVRALGKAVWAKQLHEDATHIVKVALRASNHGAIMISQCRIDGALRNVCGVEGTEDFDRDAVPAVASTLTASESTGCCSLHMHTCTRVTMRSRFEPHLPKWYLEQAIHLGSGSIFFLLSSGIPMRTWIKALKQKPPSPFWNFYDKFRSKAGFSFSTSYKDLVEVHPFPKLGIQGSPDLFFFSFLCFRPHSDLCSATMEGPLRQ